MTKTRRGAKVLASNLRKQVAVFTPGDVVTSVLAGSIDFIGQVTRVDPKCAKVFVNWGDGCEKQHDPEEIQLYPVQCPGIASKMLVANTITRRGRFAKEWPTEEARAEYLKEHPDADESKHTVNEGGGKGGLGQKLKGLGQSVKKGLNKAKDKSKLKGDFTGKLWQESEDAGDKSPGVWDVGGGSSVSVSGSNLDVQWKDGEEGIKKQKVNVEDPESNPEPVKDALKKAKLWDKVVELSKQLAEVDKKYASIAADGTPSGDMFVGDPEEHGIDEPIGGGFSIMQNLVEKQRKEIKEEAEAGPLVAPQQADMGTDEEIAGDQNAPGGDPNAPQEAPSEAAIAGLKSRRALYWGDKGRVYRMTRREQEEGSCTCPKCREQMEKQPFTKSDKLFTCPGCGFKIPTSKVVDKKIEIEIEPDGSVEVEVEPVGSEPIEASFKGARRGRFE